MYCSKGQDHGLDKALDQQLIADARGGARNRVAGHARKSYDPQREPHRRHDARLRGHAALRRRRAARRNTIDLTFHGSAGQSFGAFVPRGITLRLEGDANDYFGKGLSGGTLVLRPARTAKFVAEENIIAGNVILYGATGGDVFIRGVVGERFCVRNSGATAVVEGVGDHGCEYMTGGRAVILGPTGRNFAAGMSGGFAFVLDPDRSLFLRMNREMVDLDVLDDDEDVEWLRGVITHAPGADRLGGRGAPAVELVPERTPVHEDLPEGLQACARSPTRRRRNAASTSTKRSWRRLVGETDGVHEARAGAAEAAADPGAHRRLAGGLRGLPGRRRCAQGARCMDCGIPFCHTGCPLGNLIPEWNDLVYRDRWEAAADRLHATNNFPEFTGRLCPAPCEAACVLGINEPAGRDQADRGRDLRPGVGRGLRAAGAGREEDGQARRRRRQRTGRAGGRAAADARRPRRHRVRARRSHRRAAALRHPRVQDGEASPRPPDRADGGGRHAVPDERERRRERPGRRPRAVRRRRARGRRDRVARPSGARPRARRACTRRWSTCRGATACSRATSTRRRSRRTASGSSSSAAATPAPTASAPRSVRARPRFTSSRSCPVRPTSASSRCRGRPTR